MFSRRFLVLAGVLVALNVSLWFAGSGLALGQGLLNQLLGSKMVRAEVIWKNGADWRADRGVITQVSATQLTLKEADGRIQPIALSSTTKVTHLGNSLPLSALSPRWRVLVIWPSNGAAVSVKVERIVRGKGKGGSPGG